MQPAAKPGREDDRLTGPSIDTACGRLGMSLIDHDYRCASS